VRYSDVGQALIMLRQLGAFREDLGTDLAVLGIVTLTFFGTLLAGAGAQLRPIACCSWSCEP